MVSPSVLCLAYNVLQGIATFLRAAIDRAPAIMPVIRIDWSVVVHLWYLLRHSLGHMYSILCVSKTLGNGIQSMPAMAVWSAQYIVWPHQPHRPCSGDIQAEAEPFVMVYIVMRNRRRQESKRVVAMASRVSLKSVDIWCPVG